MHLVSRGFREICRDPALWAELNVRRHYSFWTEPLWQSFLRWLAACGSGLQKLDFNCSGVCFLGNPDVNGTTCQQASIVLLSFWKSYEGGGALRMA